MYGASETSAFLQGVHRGNQARLHPVILSEADADRFGFVLRERLSVLRPRFADSHSFPRGSSAFDEYGA
jgi:hypothetical protein